MVSTDCNQVPYVEWVSTESFGRGLAYQYQAAGLTIVSICKAQELTKLSPWKTSNHRETRLAMPDPVYLPRILYVPGLQKVSVDPQADGTINVVGNFKLGTLNLSGGPLSFNPLALLTLFEDLAADLPKIVADVTAVFAATPSVPTPSPTVKP